MSKRPNILLFFPDQHRPDWLGFLGNVPVRTPNIDRLAARGATFTRAICASPLCAPSRACLASAREYDACGVRDNSDDYPLDQPTYYRRLRDEGGYYVIGVGKFDLHKASYVWGLDGKNLLNEWGFSDGIDNAGKIDAILSGAEQPKDPYMAFLHRRGLARAHVEDLKSRKSYAATHPTPLPEDAYCDNWVAENGLRLLADAPKDRPWHLVVNFTGPHSPMDITRQMAELYRDVDFPQPVAPTRHRAGNSFAPEVHVQIRRNYAAMIENIDRWVGKFIDLVKARGEFDNTIFVFTSDHGEMLGDLGCWGKTQPYQPSVGIPLVMAGPGIAPGIVCDTPTSLIDVSATFLDAAGVSPLDGMDGISLSATLGGSSRPHRQVAKSGLGPWRLVYDGRYKLIEGYTPGRKGGQGKGSGAAGSPAEPPPPPETLLFDHANDPWELRNLAATLPREVERLRALGGLSS